MYHSTYLHLLQVEPIRFNFKQFMYITHKGNAVLTKVPPYTGFNVENLQEILP